MIHRVIPILIYNFVLDASTCVPFMCTSTAKAKAPFSPREWRQIDVTSRALEKLCHSSGKPHLNGIILPGPFRSQSQYNLSHRAKQTWRLRRRCIHKRKRS